MTEPTVDRLAVRGGAPVRTRPFPALAPYDGEAERLVLEAVRSQSLYGIGAPMHSRFESGFAELYGAVHAIATSSGTAAVHTAVAALDLDPGSEIITCPITDAGSIAPIVFQGCIPVFADVDDRLGMDPDDVERKIGERTGAILVVHLFGAAADMRRITAIADRHGIPVVEDCSQAHVTELDGRYLGRWGRIGVFSLQQSKHMTTGDGGVTITDDDGYARRMRLFRDKGWTRDGGWADRCYEILGLNYRMTELQAAVGIAQLPVVRQRVLRRQALGDHLAERLEDVPGVRPHRARPGSDHAYWLFALELDGASPRPFAEALGAEGVPAAAGYIGEPIYLGMRALSEQRTFGASGWPFRERGVTYRRGLCPRAEAVLERIVTIRIHEAMTQADMDDVAAAVTKVAAGLDEEGR